MPLDRDCSLLPMYEVRLPLATLRFLLLMLTCLKLRSMYQPAFLFVAMYSPRIWPQVANKIAALLSGDGTPILSDLQSTLNLSDINSPQQTTYAIWAISCADGPPLRGKFTPEEGVQGILDAAIATYETATTLFAGLHLEPTCLTWRAEEIERYTGPWNSSLANTILIIGNTADVRLHDHPFDY